MISKLLDWAVHNRVVVVLLALALASVGGYAFVRVNVEAYPDPAPAIVEVVAQYPGASAEEVERLVTIPLEVGMAGMPGLKYSRSKSLFGLSHIRNQFSYGIDYVAARQEVLNRLPGVELPKGVTAQLSPASPIGEIYRYTLTGPKDALGRDIYTLNDLKAFQDWTLERELLRIPRIAGIVSAGGTVKRYEIRPDPDRLKEYGISLSQLEESIANSNANVGGDYVVQGGNVQVVRGIGLIGGGEDPMVVARGMSDPVQAAAYLRSEEERRIREIREVVIDATNNVPIRVEHVVEGGPLRAGEPVGKRGVVISYQTRQGQMGITRPLLDEQSREVLNPDGSRVLINEDDKVQGIVLLRKGEQSLPALQAVRDKIEELNNTPGRLLPGTKIEVFYNRSSLIDVTTETVRRNLVEGMALVTMILLMFLGNVRSSIIVAINIPLALMFAFCVLFLRGKSANLLSIGAVDFGIIVDSTVIMVEHIFHRVSSGKDSHLPLQDRVLKASREVERSLFYSTIIMVCALLPLFTMQGPEGQIFGPMADTYAFALGGALILALTISPVLCVFSFGNLKPTQDNILVRSIKRVYLFQLKHCLDHRWLWTGGITLLVAGTIGTLPLLGREFMPELEEGNVVVRGTFPVNVSLEEVARNAHIARHIILKFPEIKLATSQVGRPDDGTDPTGYYNMECLVPLKRNDDWPIPPGAKRQRTKAELIEELNEELSRNIIGVNWDFSQYIRDNVMESLSGVKGENSVKIFGPDLDELETMAIAFYNKLDAIDGISDPGVFRIKGQTNLSFPIDRAKCALWNVRVSEIEDVIQTAVGGKPFSQMIEGEKTFDITLRWPEKLRQSMDYILDIPVDVMKNRITPSNVASLPGTPLTGSSVGLSQTGTATRMPSLTGSSFNATLDDLSRVPRRRLRDLVTPIDDQGRPDANGSFLKPGASTIYREQGNRLIAVKFGVRGRDLASAVEDAQAQTKPLLKAGYTTTWSGEFQQMQEAEHRMLIVIILSFALIMVMLYLAFFSLMDAFLVFANVGVMSMGGVWTLLLTGLNFNISAAVGFISILGVSVMNGLLMVSSFNDLRYRQVPLREAILEGTETLVRPITMTALAAILGLLPAAFSTQIGSQSQRPLAIVVVGGMLSTLVFFNLVPLLYSYYGHREPLVGVGHARE